MRSIIVYKNRKSLYHLKFSDKFFYELHVKVILELPSEHPTVFITIFRCYMKYSKNTLFRTSGKYITIFLLSLTISGT